MKNVIPFVFPAILIFLFVWFGIGYSPTRKQFSKDVSTSKEMLITPVNQVFMESDFDKLPLLVRKYLTVCGYIGKPKMSALNIEFKDVLLMREREQPPLRVDYTQYNFIETPTRLALIKSSLFGIPFEGYDYYLNGKGGMKGVVGKLVTIFHQTGKEMDKAALVTFLSEILLLPGALTEDYLTMEQLNETEVKATITSSGTIASGIFTFNETGEMVSFTTNDRAVTNPDGSMQYVKWSIYCEDYQINENGILFPTMIKAVWHYDDGDFVYFDGETSQIKFIQ